MIKTKVAFWKAGFYLANQREIPRRPNSRATPQRLDQRSKMGVVVSDDWGGGGDRMVKPLGEFASPYRPNTR